MPDELDLRTRVEIETLHEFLDEISFYALLQLPETASRDDIEFAFAQESRKFHPDRFFGVRNPQFLRNLTAIYRKISEAHSVLKDPDLKSRYDQKLGITGAAGGEDISKAGLVQESEMEEKAQRIVCSSRQGRRYYDLAMTARRANDLTGVVMNLQFALSFEAANETLQEMLAQAKTDLDKLKAKENLKVRMY